MEDTKELDSILLELLGLFPETKFVKSMFSDFGDIVMFEGDLPFAKALDSFRYICYFKYPHFRFSLPRRLCDNLSIWAVWCDLILYFRKRNSFWNVEVSDDRGHMGDHCIEIYNEKRGEYLYHRIKQLHEVQSLSSIL